MGFEEELKAFGGSVDSKMRTFRRALALKVFSRVILRTSVDTGRARANWQTTAGTPAAGTVDSTDQQAAISGIGPAAASVQGDESIFLTNNLPYIEALENGHSQQAPAGMVAVTLAEFEGLADQVARQVQGGSDGDS